MHVFKRVMARGLLAIYILAVPFSASALVAAPPYGGTGSQGQAQASNTPIVSPTAYLLENPGNTGVAPAPNKQIEYRPRAVCPKLSGNLTRSARGKEVQLLQEFLLYKGFLTYDNMTGFYGKLTEEAVKAYQAKEGLIATGTPSSTGFGAVGPRTRAYLYKQCAKTVSSAPVTESVVDVSNNQGANNDQTASVLTGLRSAMDALRYKMPIRP